MEVLASTVFSCNILLYHVMSFFFFLSLGDHIDLHSFPTRRSSDLQRARHLDAARRRGGVAGDRARLRRARDERSEEHTSELQSRQYLVCRLLLEKKKI